MRIKIYFIHTEVYIYICKYLYVFMYEVNAEKMTMPYESTKVADTQNHESHL
jgi:hypothetical protein